MDNTNNLRSFSQVLMDILSLRVLEGNGFVNEKESFNKLTIIQDFLIPGNYVLLGGDPGIGKTFLVYDLIKTLFVMREKSVGIFSLASTEYQVLTELVGRFCGIKPSTLSTGMLHPYQWDILDKRLGYLVDSDSPRQLFIDTKPFMTLGHLEDRLKEFVDHGCEYIFIDFVQLLDVEDKVFQSLYEKMTYISHYLKNLAKYHNIPIVVICQISRQVTEKDIYRTDRYFSLSDFRDTGAFEEDADVVMMVDRPEVRHIYEDDNGRCLRDTMKVIILKDRNSHPVGEILLHYDYQDMEFQSYSDYLKGQDLHYTDDNILDSKINGSEHKDDNYRPF